MQNDSNQHANDGGERESNANERSDTANDANERAESMQPDSGVSDGTFDGGPTDDELADPEPLEESRYADPSDARVTRDGEGEKIPQDYDVPSLGPHRLMPLSYGDVQQYMGDGSQHEVEEEGLARIIDKFVQKPDYADDADEWAQTMGERPRGRVTAAYIEDMKPMTVRDILMSLFEVSGINASVMMEGTTANVEVDEGNQ